MEDNKDLILIDSDVVPSIFIKVLEAKRLLSKNEVKTSTQACKAVNISRSAFYKYKDSVFLYEDKTSRKTITLYLKLSDEPGVLSAVLSVLYKHKANILTVNQNMSIDSVADVTITIKSNEKTTNYNVIKNALKKVDGVIDLKRI